MEDERGGACSTLGRSRQSFNGKTLSDRTPRKKCAETREKEGGHVPPSCAWCAFVNCRTRFLHWRSQYVSWSRDIKQICGD
jgi:hypothetical protein